jgi:hypothetical protein
MTDFFNMDLYDDCTTVPSHNSLHNDWGASLLPQPEEDPLINVFTLRANSYDPNLTPIDEATGDDSESSRESARFSGRPKTLLCGSCHFLVVDAMVCDCKGPTDEHR